MPHANTKAGGFLTPIIVKTGTDGKEVTVNNLNVSGAAKLALKIGYLMEVAAYTTPKDVRLANKTAREAARDALDSLLMGGEKEDIFTYYVPSGVDDAGNYLNDNVAILRATRGELITTGEILMEADNIIGPAEKAIAELVSKVGKCETLNPMPNYGGKAAKRASGASPLPLI